MPIPRIGLKPEALPQALHLLKTYPRLLVRVEEGWLAVLIPDRIEGGLLAKVLVPLHLIPRLEALFAADAGPKLEMSREAQELLRKLGIVPRPRREREVYARR